MPGHVLICLNTFDMNNFMQLRISLAAFLIILLNDPSQGQETIPDMKIWFNKPTATCNDALPVGNGSLGAMIFGGPST